MPRGRTGATDHDVRQARAQYPEGRACTGCGEHKEAFEFDIDYSGRDRKPILKARCKECEKKRYAKANEDPIRRAKKRQGSDTIAYTPEAAKRILDEAQQEIKESRYADTVLEGIGKRLAAILANEDARDQDVMRAMTILLKLQEVERLDRYVQVKEEEAEGDAEFDGMDVDELREQGKSIMDRLFSSLPILETNPEALQE